MSLLREASVSFFAGSMLKNEKWNKCTKLNRFIHKARHICCYMFVILGGNWSYKKKFTDTQCDLKIVFWRKKQIVLNISGNCTACQWPVVSFHSTKVVQRFDFRTMAIWLKLANSEVHLEPSWRSTMEPFGKIVNG